MAFKAEKLGRDSRYFSPFARSAAKQRFMRRFMGGKEDDITVIVG